MNKVIAEFLSCQQPHPELMANVVFQVRTLSCSNNNNDNNYYYTLLLLPFNGNYYCTTTSI